MSHRYLPPSSLEAGLPTPSYLASEYTDCPYKYHGIKDSMIPLTAEKGSGTPLFFLKSTKGDFYLWNALSGNTWLVKEPRKMEDILPRLGDPSEKDIKLEEVYGEEDEEEDEWNGSAIMRP